MLPLTVCEQGRSRHPPAGSLVPPSTTCLFRAVALGSGPAQRGTGAGRGGPGGCGDYAPVYTSSANFKPRPCLILRTSRSMVKASMSK